MVSYFAVIIDQYDNNNQICPIDKEKINECVYEFRKNGRIIRSYRFMNLVHEYSFEIPAEEFIVDKPYILQLKTNFEWTII